MLEPRVLGSSAPQGSLASHNDYDTVTSRNIVGQNCLMD